MGKQITSEIDGETVTGEITSLAQNDMEVTLLSHCGGHKGLHIPHFEMAYRTRWLADTDGNLTERGRQVAEELLEELYRTCTE